MIKLAVYSYAEQFTQFLAQKYAKELCSDALAQSNQQVKFLNAQTIKLPRITVSGYKALYPSAFGVAKEDIGCRCALVQKSEFDTEDFTKINNFNDEILEFKSQDDYKKFKEKFWSESNIAYMRYVDKLTEKYDNMQNALKNMTDREYKRYTELFNGSALK